MPERTNKQPINAALPASLVAQSLEKTQIAKYHTKGGHGFSAEDANNFADLFRGKGAKVVGISNELNGADRIVDGLLVQSKYFQSAAKTLAAAFDPGSGAYRYAGQLLEVPKDQYDACLEMMRDRIAQGKVPGFENPADAEKIIRQGTVTYEQARNIARSGNIDSLVFDATTQAITSTYIFAISFAVTFAQSRWRGESSQEATKVALGSALLAGGTTLVTGVLGAQLLRLGAFTSVESVRGGVNLLASTSIGRDTVHLVARGSLGKAVSGAAAVNHVAKLLRSNVLTATIAAIATSTPEFYSAAFDRSISWRQFTKNISVNSAGVAAGTAGWLSGAALGAAMGSAVPGIGTAAGGVVGGILGALGASIAGSAAAKTVADRLADDDSQDLIPLLQQEIQTLAFEYLLDEPEIESISCIVRTTVTPQWLRQMYKEMHNSTAESPSNSFVRREFEPHFDAIVRSRPTIVLPSPEELHIELYDLTNTLLSSPVSKDAEGTLLPLSQAEAAREESSTTN